MFKESKEGQTHYACDIALKEGNNCCGCSGHNCPEEGATGLLSIGGDNKTQDEISTEVWEDGYSFAIYKVKEIIEDIIKDGKIAYNKELDILKEKINKLQRP